MGYKPFPMGGTLEEKRQFVLELREENARLARKNTETLRSQSEAVLVGATQICARAGLPFSQILVFAWGGFVNNGWFYDGQAFQRWTLIRGKPDPEYTRFYDEYKKHRCVEIPVFNKTYYPPFALLWFNSTDQAQELIGMALPWITLGYWRPDDMEDQFGPGRFYRLWLVSEK